MDQIGTVISFLSLALCGWVYFRHEKKLKTQQEEINALQLDRMLKEKEDDLRARMEIRSSKAGANRILCITNTGKATARDLRFACSEELTALPDPGKLFPYPSLRPGESVEMKYAPEMLETTIQTVTLEWDDDLKEGNCESYTLSLSS